ncbi:hypothetical protein [Arthrobacter sp. NPDC056727]|uniref:hypothetical protein n=1 Tax=Arthrobacter sp. NPDC056727 TaxID=3345927 RepID=UPI00367346A7
MPETGAPGLLSLSSSVYPLTLPVLEPDESFSWQIGLTMTEPAAASLLQVTAAGEIAGTDRYVVAVEECAVQWQGSSGRNGSLSCPSGAISRIPSTALAALRQDVQVPLRNLRAGTTSFLRFTLARPAGSAESGGTSLTLGIGVSAMGEDTGGVGFPDPGQSPDPDQSPEPSQPSGPGQSSAPGPSGDASPPGDAHRADMGPDDTSLGDTGAAILPALLAGGALVLLGAAVVAAFRGSRPSARTTR